MTEQINLDDSGIWDQDDSPIRVRHTKFHGLRSDGETKKIRHGRSHSGFRPPLSRILSDSTESAILDLVRGAGIPLRFISEQSIERLEFNFNNQVKINRLERSDLERWATLTYVPEQELVIRSIRGKIFEEIVTREFVESFPNYFLANPRLTRNIITPIVFDKSPYEFSSPDHLVFLKAGHTTILAGFMEDKKFINHQASEELLDQLRKQWNLWLLLSTDIDSQNRFRGEVSRNIPSIPYRMNMPNVSEGIIWLTTTKESQLDGIQLPAHVRPFYSSVSGHSINRLADTLIIERFLPRLLASSPR